MWALLLGAAFGVLYINEDLLEERAEVTSLCFLRGSWTFEMESLRGMRQTLSHSRPFPTLMFLMTFSQDFFSGEPLFASIFEFGLDSFL